MSPASSEINNMWLVMPHLPPSQVCVTLDKNEMFIHSPPRPGGSSCLKTRQFGDNVKNPIQLSKYFYFNAKFFMYIFFISSDFFDK